MLTIPYGSCVSWSVPPELNNSFNQWFGWLQRKVTGQEQTHASMIMTPHIERGPNWYYEYELSVTARINQMTPNNWNVIFDILAPVEIKQKALEKLIDDTYGDVYAIWQTLIFLVRRVIEEFGGDGRRIWNPFPWLGICSEGMYKYLFELAVEMNWTDLQMYMREWSPDVFHAGDARKVLDWMVEHGYAKIIWPET